MLNTFFLLVLSIDSSCLCGHEYGCITKKNEFFISYDLNANGKIVLNGPYEAEVLDF